MPPLKGTEESVSYVQCFLYLVSSSINVYFSYYMAGYLLDRLSLFLEKHHNSKLLGQAHTCQGDKDIAIFKEICHLQSF